MKTSTKYALAGAAAAGVSVGGGVALTYDVFVSQANRNEEVKVVYERRENALSALENCLTASPAQECNPVFLSYQSANQEYVGIKEKHSVSLPKQGKIDWWAVVAGPVMFLGLVGASKAFNKYDRNKELEHLEELRDKRKKSKGDQ